MNPKDNESRNALIKKQFNKVLNTFNSLSESIHSSALTTADGCVVASRLSEGVDPDRFGAMCASLLALANTASREIDRGDLKKVLIESEDGSVLIIDVGNNLVLTVASGLDLPIGRIFLEAKKAAKAINTLVEESGWKPGQS